MGLHDLLFSQNQPQKSAGDYFFGIKGFRCSVDEICTIFRFYAA